MSKFILSCSTVSTEGVGRDSILSCFEHASKAGYRYWALCHPVLRGGGSARWFNYHLANKLAAEAGFQGCTEVYGPVFPNDSVEKAKEMAPDIALLFELAENMNSPFVVITGGRKKDGRLEPAIAGIKELMSMLDSDLKLALENHYNSLFELREDYDRIFSEIDDPRVGITVDTGHFHSAGVDWKELIRSYSDKIYNIHLKDHVGTQSVPLGEGDVDLRGLVEELHKIDYDGALALELEVRDKENVPRYCADSYTYMKAIIEEVTGNTPL